MPQKLRKTFLGHLSNPLGLLYAKLAQGKQSKAPEFIISFVWNIVGITQENLDLLPVFFYDNPGKDFAFRYVKVWQTCQNCSFVKIG